MTALAIAKPPSCDASSPVSPAPPPTHATDHPIDLLTLRAHRGHDCVREPEEPAADREDSPATSPLSSASPGPRSPVAGPSLPPHIDPDLLLLDYHQSQNHHELARKHDLDLDALLAWAAHPDTQRTLDRLRAFNARRAEDIRAHNAAAAAAALGNLVRSPLDAGAYTTEAHLIRAMETVLRAALAILTPMERAKSFARTLTLRRAIAALSPRRARNSGTGLRCAPVSAPGLHRAAPSGAGFHPADPVLPFPRARASSPRRPAGPIVPPVPRRATDVATRHRCAAAIATPTADAPQAQAAQNKSPKGSSEIAGSGAKRSERQARNAETFDLRDPEGPEGVAQASVPSTHGATPRAAQTTRATDLRHRAGALPRAP